MGRPFIDTTLSSGPRRTLILPESPESLPRDYPSRTRSSRQVDNTTVSVSVFLLPSLLSPHLWVVLASLVPTPRSSLVAPRPLVRPVGLGCRYRGVVLRRVLYGHQTGPGPRRTHGGGEGVDVNETDPTHPPNLVIPGRVPTQSRWVGHPQTARQPLDRPRTPGLRG